MSLTTESKKTAKKESQSSISLDEVKQCLKSVDGPARLLRFVTFVHLPFLFGLSTFFVASLVFMKGTSCCVIKRNF